jgi:hypothetical protein
MVTAQEGGFIFPTRLARDVKDQICEDFCESWGKSCDPIDVNLTGWSRGATAAMGVAQMLNDEGCSCGGFLGIGATVHKPVYVNWVGLFDAVEMVLGTEIMGTGLVRPRIPGDPGFPRSVPSNVESFAHAMKTEAQLLFPTTRFGGNERAFLKNDGTPTTHSDIGVSHDNNGAYQWIKSEASNAGVEF